MNKQILEYTEHALDRMLSRGITRTMVEETLTNPERAGMGYKRRFVAYRRFDNKRVKVVYAEEGDTCFVISVMWD